MTMPAQPYDEPGPGHNQSHGQGPVPGVPYVTRLRIEQLFVDHLYQRPLNELFVRRAVQRFEPAAIGVLIVGAREDGTKALIDGQQRSEILRRRQIADVECLVLPSSGPEWEASLFNLLNTKKTVSARERFRARAISDEPIAADISRIVEEEGWTIQWRGSCHLANHITAVQGLEELYRRDPELLRSVLKLAHETWPDEVGVAERLMLRGLALFLQRHGRDPKFDEARFARAVGAQPARLYAGRARAVAELGRGTASLHHMRRLFLDAYNKGLKADQRLGGGIDDDTDSELD